jgi:hypothetical protein
MARSKHFASLKIFKIAAFKILTDKGLCTTSTTGSQYQRIEASSLAEDEFYRKLKCTYHHHQNSDRRAMNAQSRMIS